jgi:Uma2 family endonuclease
MLMTATQQHPFAPPLSELHRLTVDQYHRMIAAGIITEDDRVELMEGLLVAMNGHNPPHDFAITALQKRLMPKLPGEDWVVRIQMPVTLDTSEPEPDLVLARGPEREFAHRHPAPGDVALVVESSDSTLPYDRTAKGSAYARNGLPEYWILNVVDHRVEVYTDPTGPDPAPVYRQRRDHNPGEMVSLVIDGQEVARFRVEDLLP